MGLNFGKMESMASTVQRYKVSDGEINAPMLIMRHPDDDSIATQAMKKHWLDKAENGAIIIPCAAMAGKPCYPCAMREAYQNNGLYGTVDKDIKKFLDGNVTHETQLLDLRGNAMHLTQRYLSAMQARDGGAAALALAELHDLLINEPVKLWGYSRTVYEIISRKIRESMSEFGKLIDPTEADTARIFWVSKPKQAQGAARFDVACKWGMAIPVPAIVYQRVRKYDDIFTDNAASCAYWDARRVQATLLENGYEALLHNAGATGLALPATQRTALPPAQPRMVAEAPVTPDSVVVSVPVVDVPAGSTVSAADLPCFGVSPNLASAQCNACPQVDPCLTTTRAKMAKPTAPAMAQAVAMPKAEPAPAVDTAGADRIKNMVAAAMAKVNGGK